MLAKDTIEHKQYTINRLSRLRARLVTQINLSNISGNRKHNKHNIPTLEKQLKETEQEITRLQSDLNEIKLK